MSTNAQKEWCHVVKTLSVWTWKDHTTVSVWRAMKEMQPYSVKVRLVLEVLICVLIVREVNSLQVKGVHFVCRHQIQSTYAFTFKQWSLSFSNLWTLYKLHVANFWCVADIDECAEGKHNCSASAYCNDTIGGFLCTCQYGYIGDGHSCSMLCLVSFKCFVQFTLSFLFPRLH